jgi:hypothetical protein
MAGAALLAAAAVALVVCSSASATGDGQTRRRGRAVLPAVYVFGDSLVDVGNNDFLPPPAPRAGFPCGVDLPRGTPGRRTGRFTNGYNLADFVGKSATNFVAQIWVHSLSLCFSSYHSCQVSGTVGTRNGNEGRGSMV